MKKVFFASDFHLGIDAQTSSREREQTIVRWLDMVAPEAERIYLVGDLFDFWFEYGTVVPKGYLRLLGKLAELRDRGLPVYFFTGNHDMWMFGYFEEELDILVFRAPVIHDIGGKRFFIGHGDGLGPGDHRYKMLKKLLAYPLCQWLFARIHPNLGIRLMKFFSGKSRAATGDEAHFLGPEKEWLVNFCEEELIRQPIDYFIFGHRHLPINYVLSNGHSRYINLGDWLSFNSYAAFDGRDVQLHYFEK